MYSVNSRNRTGREILGLPGSFWPFRVFSSWAENIVKELLLCIEIPILYVVKTVSFSYFNDVWGSRRYRRKRANTNRSVEGR